MDDQRNEGSAKSVLNDNEEKKFVVVPPDGGWGWIVVGAAFLSNLISDGILYTFGIFLNELSKSFNVTVGNTTKVGSVMTLFYYMIGPFVSALLNRFGFRFVGIFGSFIAMCSFALASICENFNWFMILGGVITGIGLGMITMPSVIVVGFYFKKWRTVATGIATCGSGIGTLLLPPIVTFLLNRMDWRNAYRILACMFVVTGAASTFYRPLIPVKAIRVEKKIKFTKETKSLNSKDSKRTKYIKWSSHRHHNIHYSTTANIIPVETVILDVPNWLEESLSHVTNGTTTAVILHQSLIRNGIKNGTIDLRIIFKRKKYRLCWSKFVKLIFCGHCQTISRPMYRDDIFFAHNLILLPAYKESLASQSKHNQKLSEIETSQGILMPKSTGYQMTVTRVTSHRKIHKSSQHKQDFCPLACLRILFTMLDFRLLKSLAFQLLIWSGMFSAFGYFVPFLYIKDCAIRYGISGRVVFWVLSTIGASNTMGRIMCGILPSVTKLKVIQFTYLRLLLAGIMTIVSGWCILVQFQFLYACLYGLVGCT